MKNFLKGIDFKLLKKQKKSLLKIIDKTKNKKEAKRLEGILTLIDTIQEQAVDKYGYKEKDVFDLDSEK